MNHTKMCTNKRDVNDYHTTMCTGGCHVNYNHIPPYVQTDGCFMYDYHSSVQTGRSVVDDGYTTMCTNRRVFCGWLPYYTMFLPNHTGGVFIYCVRLIGRSVTMLHTLNGAVWDIVCLTCQALRWVKSRPLVDSWPRHWTVSFLS